MPEKDSGVHTGGSASGVHAHALEPCCPVVELRQYVLKQGRRDEFIALFEEQFIEGQESQGMRILGHFHDRAHPDRFVWLRGFCDMETRREALENFYYGPIWQEHRTAANDAISDSDNVLLLKPAHPTAGFRVDPATRPTRKTPATEGGIIVATVYSLNAPVDASFIELFDVGLAPVLRSAGATLLGQFITEPSENTFPRLPVRTGEHVVVWFASFSGVAAYLAYQATLAANQTWIRSLVPTLRERLSKPEDVLELAPTKRSLIRHR